MKTALALIAILVPVLGWFTGCGQKTEFTSEVKVQITTANGLKVLTVRKEALDQVEPDLPFSQLIQEIRELNSWAEDEVSENMTEEVFLRSENVPIWKRVTIEDGRVTSVIDSLGGITDISESQTLAK